MSPIPSRLESIQAAVYGVPWAITEQGMNLITGIIEAHLSGVRLTAEEAQARAASQTYGSVGTATTTGTQVALLRLHGPIISRASENMMVSGGVDPQQFAARVRAAADNADVSRIVISVDSPGGSVSGTRTAADAVAYARSKKEVIAVADDMAASAAMWIAAQATTVIADPGATLGSIGVIMSIKDVSEKNTKEGVQLHVLRSGDEKALGQPGEVITDTTLAHYREQLMVFHDQFVQAIATGRNLPLARARELATGRTWIGQQAVDVGLADYVGTLQQAINGEYSGPAAARPARPAALSPAPRAETTQGGDAMPPEVLAMLGLQPDASAEEIMTAIRAQRANAAATMRAGMLADLGLTEEPDQPADLKALAAQAQDGQTYREAQLDRLHALTITTEGNDERGQQAADDARAVYAGQSLERINAQIIRLEAKRDALPDGPRSRRGDTDTKPTTVNLSGYGVRRARR